LNGNMLTTLSGTVLPNSLKYLFPPFVSKTVIRSVLAVGQAIIFAGAWRAMTHTVSICRILYAHNNKIATLSGLTGLNSLRCGVFLPIVDDDDAF